jgi:hypothetical protein
MTDNSNRGQLGKSNGETRKESTAGEGARRAWAKPQLHRISLQRTLAGSGAEADTFKATSAIPT